MNVALAVISEGGEGDGLVSSTGSTDWRHVFTKVIIPDVEEVSIRAAPTFYFELRCHESLTL